MQNTANLLESAAKLVSKIVLVPVMTKLKLYKLMIYSTFIVMSQGSMATEESDFPGIENLMSAEQYGQSGLARLTEQEMNALNKWLTTYTANDAEVVKSRSVTVRKIADELETRAHIIGEFRGWTGKTLFKLDNGQIWQQRLNGKHFYRAVDPEVIISKNALGFYRLEIAATGKRVGVKRLK